MSLLPISVCMLVKDEADRLPRSLPPLAEFAELLVFDSGSQDTSIALCQAAGATIIEGAWEGFATTRRKHFARATQPWILWLDADEVLGAELLAEIRALFGQGDPPHAAYELNRMVCFEGQWIRHGDWFPDWNLRIFRRGDWELPERAVHETVVVEGAVGRLRSPMEHHSFRDREDLHRRSLRYAELWAEQKRAEGKHASIAEAFFKAVWKFKRGYFFKAGFLDGSKGAYIAWQNALETWRKYRLLRG